MALELALALPTGINVPGAYARISNIMHSHNELTVHVQFWADAAARIALLPHVKEHSFSLPWQETVSLTTAYTLLKNEDMFVTAVDV